jgi:DNA-binding HxlR family transcriptional regulator
MATKSAHRLQEMMEQAVQRGDVYAPDCPSRGVLEHVTSRWGVLVLVGLLDGTHRFSELKRKVAGVSDKMLAQTVKALEHDGFVERTAHLEVPVRVEYNLTGPGREVAVRIAELTDWIEVHIGDVLLARQQHG